MKTTYLKLAGATAIIALSSAVNASVINVSGVTWDPDATAPASDFIGKANYEQWFQTTAGPANFSNAVQLLDPSSPVGNYLAGSMKFTEINGVNNILGDPFPESDPARFCAGCELTATFGNILVNNAILQPVPGGVVFDYDFDLTGSFARVYSDTSLNYGNQLPEDADARDGTLFLDLRIDLFDFIPVFNPFDPNSIAGGFVVARFSAIGGSAMSNFDTNLEAGGSDLTYTSSFQGFAPGDFFGSGTGEFTGDTIPEPGSLALIGLGLLGMATAAKRKKS